MRDTKRVRSCLQGAAPGDDAIPAYYLEDLKLRDLIGELAEDLWSDCRMSEYDAYRDPLRVSKYIMVDYDAGKRKELPGARD